MEAQTLKLPAELDIRAAVPLAEDLLARRGSPLMVSGTDVTRAGAQCLQVLLSAAATWRADGQHIQIVDASHALTVAIAACGLQLSQFKAGEQ